MEASRLGVDALGLVFYPGSSRFVSLEVAAKISNAVPAFVNKVALFVDPDKELVEEVLSKVQIDLLQFHGNETAGFCQQFDVPYIKAIRMESGVDLEKVGLDYSSSKGILLDAWHPTEKGGTGESFDWSRVPENFSLPIILAGGLNAENVSMAIKVARPYAVDVSSGVERQKGLKDHAKMTRFIEEVNKVER